MDWKQFFKPQISKVIIFALLVWIFGVPATLVTCQGFVRIAEPPSPCIGQFAFSNIISRNIQVFDGVRHFSYNPIIVTLYPAGLYLALSLIFYMSGYNWKKATLYVIGIILIILLICILFAIIGTRSFIAQ